MRRTLKEKKKLEKIDVLFDNFRHLPSALEKCDKPASMNRRPRMGQVVIQFAMDSG